MGTGERQERAARIGAGDRLAGWAARLGVGGGPASWLKGRRALAVAAALGLLAGAIGFGAIRAREREVREGWALTEVLVATTDLGAGEVLAGEHVGRRQIPARFVTTSVLRPEHAVQAVGQRLLVPVQAGDPLLWTHFETLRGVERLANVVQPRGRAVTIAVDDTGAVGGFVRPNDHVDVLATVRDPATHEPSTVTVLQNVVVLATGTTTGQAAAPVAETFSHVSLLVLPEEAELLVLARELGTLHLVLRHPDDLEIRERAATTPAALLAGERSKDLERIRHQTIQVIRGVGESRETASWAP
jgi:pilus assembly protein CpaB